MVQECLNYQSESSSYIIAMMSLLISNRIKSVLGITYLALKVQSCLRHLCHYPHIVCVDWIAADGRSWYLSSSLWMVDGHLLFCEAHQLTFLFFYVLLSRHCQALISLTDKRASQMLLVILHILYVMTYTNSFLILSLSQAQSCFFTGYQEWCSYSTLPRLLFSYERSFVLECSGSFVISMITTFIPYKMCVVEHAW